MAVKIEGEVVLKNPNLEPTVGAYKALQQQIKSARNELAGLEQGSDAFNRKAQEIGRLSNEVDDLNKSVAAVSGQPIENLTGSFGLLSNQVQSLDFDGAKQSLSQLFAVVAANPFTALISVITLVIVNFKEISEVVSKFTGNVDTNALAIKEQTAEIEYQKTAMDSLISRYERHIGLLEAQGASYEQIAVARVDAFEKEIAELDLLANEYNALFAMQEEGSEDQKKTEIEYTKIRQAQADLRHKIELEFAKADKHIRDENIEDAKKAAEAQKKLDEAAAAARLELLLKYQKEITEGETAQLELEAREAHQAALYQVDIDAQTEAQRRLSESAYKFEQDELARQKQNADIKAYTEKNLANSLGALNQLVYESKVSGLEKGSAAEQEAAKKAFELNKGLQLAVAINDGIKAGIGAFATGNSQGGPILGAIYAAASAVVTLAQIAKIRNSKFTPSVKGGGSISASSGSITSGTTPQVPATQAIPNAPITQLNPNGTVQGGSTRVWVSANDIKSSVNEVEVLENRSSY